MDIDLRFTLRIGQPGNSHAFFGPGPYNLLKLVGECHSLNKAATTLNMSYSKALRIIKEAEKELGFLLIDSIAGGTGGGGSTLTPKAIRLMQAYHAMDTELRVCAEELFQKHMIPAID